jgi:hypothetical protein
VTNYLGLLVGDILLNELAVRVEQPKENLALDLLSHTKALMDRGMDVHRLTTLPSSTRYSIKPL